MNSFNLPLVYFILHNNKTFKNDQHLNFLFLLFEALARGDDHKSSLCHSANGLLLQMIFFY